MGLLKSIFKNFSCKSSCSLNDELNDIIKYIKCLELDDLKYLIEIHEYKKSRIEESKEEINTQINLKLQNKKIVSEI